LTNNHNKNTEMLSKNIFEGTTTGLTEDESRQMHLGHLFDSGNNAVGVDAVLGDQVVGGSGAGHLPHCQHLDPGGLVGERREHRLAQTALGVVVLDRDDAAAALEGVLHHGGLVQRLDGEGVEHARVHAALFKDHGRLHRLVQGDAGADQQHAVLGRFVHHVRLSNLREKRVFSVSIKKKLVLRFFS